MKIKITILILVLFSSISFAQNSYEKSYKELGIKDHYFDSNGNIYSNYRYRVAFDGPNNWKSDYGVSIHTIYRTYERDSSITFTINVIELKKNGGSNWWTNYEKNKIEIESATKKSLEKALNSKIKNYTTSKTYILNNKAIKRSWESVIKNQDEEYEFIDILQQLIKGDYLYTFGLCVPKIFYESNQEYYNNIFLGIHLLHSSNIKK